MTKADITERESVRKEHELSRVKLEPIRTKVNAKTVVTKHPLPSSRFHDNRCEFLRFRFEVPLKLFGEMPSEFLSFLHQLWVNCGGAFQV